MRCSPLEDACGQEGSKVQGRDHREKRRDRQGEKAPLRPLWKEKRGGCHGVLEFYRGLVVCQMSYVEVGAMTDM